MTATIAKFALVLPLVLLIYSYLGEPVTTLDTSYTTGMENAVATFGQTIHGLIQYMPWLEVPFDLILWAFGIKLALLTLGFIKWVVGLIF